MDEKSLIHIKSLAINYYVDLAPAPRMDGASFNSYCWLLASIEFLNSKGFNIECDVELEKK